MHKKGGVFLLILLVLFLVSIGYNIILYKLNLNYKHSILELTQESEKQKVDLERINQQYRETIGLLETNRKDKEAIVESLNQLGLDYNNLSQRYSSTIDRANSLERLAQIDDELLKKYSKFYFLNENYLPVYLVAINTEYVEPGKKISLLPEVKFRLENMILTAKSEDINIFVNSGYRSFEEQKNLKRGTLKSMVQIRQTSFPQIKGIVSINWVLLLTSQMEEGVWIQILKKQK
jgi:LAS superfamily LD-carboxypeptidase LdcB